MYDIYYLNNLNEKVNFVQWPYMVTGGDIFDNSYDAIEENEYIHGFDRGITKKKLMIDIKANGIQFAKAVDTLEDITEKDIVKGSPGRLYVGSSYLKCWITGTSKDRWIQDIYSISNELAVMTDYPYWINEKKFSFYKRSDADPGDSSQWLEFPYEFPYEYAKVRNSKYMDNDHYTDSGFKMIIYGPCINPLVRISGHVYELRATLYDGEYAVIDSSTRYAKDRKIVKVKIDGTEENLFNSRNMDSDIWKKIPPGQNIVSWSGDFDFEIILFNERGGPRWNLS